MSRRASGVMRGFESVSVEGVWLGGRREVRR